MYYIGIDGGGTKTRGILGNERGEIKADMTFGPSNHQIVGLHNAEHAIKALINALIDKSHLTLQDISFIYLGLSGADIEADFKILNDCVERIVGTTPFLIENDTWPVLRSGLKTCVGAVSIYGTGANSAAVDSDGKQTILRSLGYPLGYAGGGLEITYEALHYAFRSEEGTYKKSALETEIPKLLGVEKLTDMIELLYPEIQLSDSQKVKIPPLVFKLSEEGDEVCTEILSRFGQTHGQMVSSILKRSALCEPIDLVLGGSIHDANGTHFTSAFKAELAKLGYDIRYHHPTLPPVAGSFLLAIDHFQSHKSPLADIIYENLEAFFNLN